MRAAEGADPERLAARIARAGALPGAARALLLDVDGTLAPIVSRPEHARVPEGALAALGSLLRGGWSVRQLARQIAANPEKTSFVLGWVRTSFSIMT